MAKAKYMAQVRRVLAQFDPRRANRYFLFGSAARKGAFRDIDLAVVGNKSSRKPLSKLRDLFYDSGIPYVVDVVDFDAADEEFRRYVLRKEPIVWIA